MSEVSSTRLYMGNLPKNVSKADVEAHFNTHGTGEITEIKLMNGFGFIEYKDALDARDVVPAFHGSDFMGQRLTVQFARGTRPRDNFHAERMVPRPRRTPHRMQISGLPGETSWQDLKDFARQSSLDVIFSETGREMDGRGFVEFETAEDLKTAVQKLNGRDFKGAQVTCIEDTQPELPRDRARSRSPRFHRPYQVDDRDRRGSPRGGGYSPRRDGYRERSPPSRRYYDDDRGRYGRSPPRTRDAVDDYGPPARRGGYEGSFRRDYAPVDSHMNGGGGGGGRALYDRPVRDYLPRDGGHGDDHRRGRY